MDLSEDDDETAPGAPTAGKRIGRYVLLAQLGSGAMGVVYKAWDPELGRQVALKLLRPEHGLGSEGRARLLREAQALARLSHQHVVAVYDAGTWRSQVFIAMELVEGVTLSGWLRRKARPWREVLEVFLRAGVGLAAAHAAGLVHRDFKPDNVLVGDDGRLRVTDFGLARHLSDQPEPSAIRKAAAEQAEGAPATPETVPGALVGSPAYMSPEQLHGRPADERSDLFGFCVSLYEGLYGQRPFPGRTLPDLREAIDAGQVRPPPSGSRVPGWLRQAVVRGLAADPGERPASMEALLEALGRDPVHRRRWWAAAAVAVLIVAAAVLFGRSSARAGMCRDLPHKLASVWDGAAREAAGKAFAATGKPFAAAAWTTTRAALDKYAADWTAQRADACEAALIRGEQSAELYDLRMACLDGRLGELSARAALFVKADDGVVAHAGDLVSSLPPLAACADAHGLHDRARPPAPLIRVKVAQVREQLSSAAAAREAGRSVATIPAAKALTADAETLGYRPLQAEASLELGRLEQTAGNLAEAAESFHAAAAFAAAGRADAVSAAAWAGVVRAELRLGRRDRAEQAARQAQAALERLGGDDVLEADQELMLADLNRAQDKLEQALQHAEKAVALIERSVQPEPLRLSAALGRLAVAHESMGRNSEAQQFLERSRALLLDRLGPDHPQLAEVDSLIADQLYYRGLLAEATDRYRAVLAATERAYGPNHPLVGHALYSLGWCLAAFGRAAEAADMQRRALSIYRHTAGNDAPMVSNVLYSLGKAELELHELPAAHEHLLAAIAVDEGSFGQRSLEVASGRLALATVLFEEGRLAEARKEGLFALELRQELLGPDHFKLVPLYRFLGQLSLREGRVAEAVSWQRQALATEEKRAPADRGQAPLTLARLGEALLAQNDLPAAKAVLEEAVTLLQKAPPDGSLPLAQFLLARTLTGLREHPDEALRLARSAREGFGRANPIWAPELKKVQAWLSARGGPAVARGGP